MRHAGNGQFDALQAQNLVDQLNEILSNQKLWDLASRELASKRYDEKIVAAFYDPMSPSTYDPWKNREAFITLPGGKNSSDGYARVLFVGTTGSGKTTIVRQLLGTDPESERFPSISAAKTTICDIEIVLDDGPFKAVVTFIPRERIRQYIAECVLSSVITKYEGAPERDVIRRFLEHSEQRFRLSYLLGNPILLERSEIEELEDDDSEVISIDEREINETERKKLLDTLNLYFDAINQLKDEYKLIIENTAHELGIDLEKASPEEQVTIQEIVEDQVAMMNKFHCLVDEIIDDVESRFDLLSKGEIAKGRDGWPIQWTYEDRNSDRSEFIRLVNRFSSNYASNFGRLLTPLVEGIRVAGPFHPEWNDSFPMKLVLMDGQGIGHTADSTSSLSTTITSRFNIADAIVLVDNAAQPMQAGPCAVLHSLAISGHESKLIIAFTHFDGVNGVNLQGNAAKKNHIIGSFDNVVHAISKNIGREAVAALRYLNPERLVFLANIQKKLPDSAKFTISELKRLLKAIESSIIPPEPIQYKPVYDVANLVLAIQKATQEFHDKWNGILGMGSISVVRPEHWTRVKALSRRFGIFKVDEYDTLRPVADLIRLLQIQISQFLSNPLKWDPTAPPDDSADKIVSIDAIKKEVFTRLHDLSKRRILEERVREWCDAYDHRGPGSTWSRARDIITIYGEAVPVPNVMPAFQANKFLFQIRELISEAVKTAGGRLKGWEQ